MNGDNDIVRIEDAAKAAEELEKNARQEPDTGSYTHNFRKSWSFGGNTFEALTFQWDKLTGADSLAIENEMLMRGKTLVTPAFTGEFLTGMAVRACTERDEAGRRVVSVSALQTMPLRDFHQICAQARSFLLRAGL